MSGRRRPLAVVPGLAALAQEQAAAVSREQLRMLGVDDQHVRHQVAAQRWQEVGPLVVVLHTGPLLPPARWWATVLSAGPPAALCAWTALEVRGLTGWERAGVHVVVRRGARPVALPWARVHESRRHGTDDVLRRDGLPAHGVERAAVDAAAWSPSARVGCGLLAAVVQQRLSTPERLGAALEQVGRVSHRSAMARALDDLAGGSRSMAEVDLVRLCRRNGLPVPVRQARRRDATGRNRYLDAEWKLSGGGRLLAEVDGGLHVEVRRWYDDALRTAEVARPGEVLLRFPAPALRAEEARVVAVLRRHLGVP